MDSESKCGLPKLVKCMPMKKKIDTFIEQMRKGLYQLVTGVFDEIKRMMIQAFFHKKETELTIGRDGVKVVAWDSISNTFYTFRRNGKEVEWMGNKGGLEVSGLMHASYFGDELVFSNYQFSVQQTESEITISYHKPGDLLLPKEVAIQTKMGVSAIHLTLIFSNWFFS
ncbi:MAG: hypothetical protein EA409_00785 [Saprospirales bacterium]|nr:MAG: hypothetical protein EA409_00785 [Saprospirales bacterium]